MSEDIQSFCNQILMDSEASLSQPAAIPSGGLTKRELFAAMAMQGMLSNSYDSQIHQPLSTANRYEIAELAVGQADALLAELAKGKE